MESREIRVALRPPSGATLLAAALLAWSVPGSVACREVQDTARRPTAPEAIRARDLAVSTRTPQTSVSATVDASTVTRLQRTLPEGSVLLRLAPGVAADTIRGSGGIVLREDEVVLARTPGDGEVLQDPERYGLPGPPPGQEPARPQVLPWEWLAMEGDRSGTVGFRPVYAVVEALRYRREEGAFLGRIAVGLVEASGSPGPARSLATAVGVRILSPDADVVDPDLVRLDRVNELLVDVSVRARSPVDSVRMEFRPAALSDGGVVTWVPVRAELDLRPSPRAIQGLGLEAADVVVALLGRSPTDAVHASVSATLGSLDRGEVEIGAAGSGRVRVRSRGLGWDTVRASAVGIGSSGVAVRYLFPWLFLGATVLGGAAGATLRVLREGERGREPPPGGTAPSPPRRPGIGAVLGGSLLGIVVAVAFFVLGLDLVGVDPTSIPFTEGAAFGLAALASWFGVRPPRSG